MLKELILKYGKDKINTFTKYPSILTLHKLGERGQLLDELTTPINSEDQMEASEKIDGTNTRILIFGNEFVIGSRDMLLHYNADLLYSMDQGIVDALKSFDVANKIGRPHLLTVIYGELYGGKVSANSKWYGTDKVKFRTFDAVSYNDLSPLELSIDKLSLWREHETDKGIVYGQNFLPKTQLVNLTSFEHVPTVPFELGDMSHETILNNLKKFIPVTNVAHSENALKRAEGVVIRNADRTKIVKLRFEDYERTLKAKNKKI